MNTAAHANVSLATPYEPVAIYYGDADYVEYLRADVPCIQRRVDEYLTLVVDLDTRIVMGFRLKGFRNFYINNLRETQQVFDNDRFLSMVSAIEKTIEIIGHEVFKEDRPRAAAYEEARRIARENNAVLPADDLLAA